MTKPRTTCVSVVGAVLVVVGIAILIVGVVVTPKEFPKLFTRKLNEYIVVDSTVCCFCYDFRFMSFIFIFIFSLRSMQNNMIFGQDKMILIIHIIW